MTTAELFLVHGPALRRRAAAVLGTDSDADDVVQDVMVRLVAKHGDAPLELRDPAPWLHTCVRNAAIDRLRGPRLEPLDDRAMPPSCAADEVLGRRLEARTVLDDVAALPERQRIALLAATVGQQPHAAVAEGLGASEETVAALVHRARATLRSRRAAREASCADIRAAIDVATLRRARASEHVRRHVRTCPPCASYNLRRRTRTAGLLGWTGWVHGVLNGLLQRSPDIVMPLVTARLGGQGALAAVAAAGAIGGGPAPSSVPVPTASVPAPPTSVVTAAPTGARSDVRVEPVWKSVVVARSTSASARPATPAPASPTPTPRTWSGCPKVTSRMTAEDRACRRAAWRRLQPMRAASIAAARAREGAAAAHPAPVPATAESAPAPPAGPAHHAKEPTGGRAPEPTPEPAPAPERTPEPEPEPVVAAPTPTAPGAGPPVDPTDSAAD